MALAATPALPTARSPPPPFYRHVGEGWRLDESGNLKIGESSVPVERLAAYFDRQFGWFYRLLDAWRLPVGIGGNPVATRNLRNLSRVTISGVAPVVPDRPTVHLFKDMVGAEGHVPWFYFFPLQIVGWVMVIGGGVLATVLIILGLLDFRAHKSHLYQQAFKRRYDRERLPGLAEIVPRIKDNA